MNFFLAIGRTNTEGMRDKDKNSFELNFMKRQFLIRPPQLNQAAESSDLSGGSSSNLTRRTFIKRSGGATVATMVAWNLQTTNARATEEDNFSSYSVMATFS